MVKIRSRYAGVTLLETILVLVIGGLIIFLSINQYLSYRRNADAYQLLANVNAIFQGMSGYYKQNCYGTSPDGTALINPGKLNPEFYGGTPPTTVPINITNDLVLPATIGFNPLVKTAGAAIDGYTAQFNLGTVKQRQVCSKGTGATLGPYDPNCTERKDVGTIVTWTAQVAVRINNPSSNANLPVTLLRLLAGDCLAASPTTQCTSSVGSGDYIIWTRLPFNANTGSVSDYWATMPLVAQFTQMYRTYPTTSLTNPGGPTVSEQYYLCGN